jgi:hypothetical protein
MATATPALETVLEAIKDAIDAIADIGTVLTSDHTLEDDIEFLEVQGLLDASSMNVWIVDLQAAPEREGDAPGEVYVIYQIGIRYWSIREADPDWSKKAREKAASVQAALSGNPDVFRIDDQVPVLDTPETVSVDSHGRTQIQGVEGTQMVFQTSLSLSVEARRWS